MTPFKPEAIQASEGCRSPAQDLLHGAKLLREESLPDLALPRVLPGFGFQREIELLVEAGLNAVEVIHIATPNGAEFLGESARIGTIEAGKQDDVVIVHDDPASTISDTSSKMALATTPSPVPASAQPRVVS